jgi:hypothetical protein
VSFALCYHSSALVGAGGSNLIDSSRHGTSKSLGGQVASFPSPRTLLQCQSRWSSDLLCIGAVRQLRTHPALWWLSYWALDLARLSRSQSGVLASVCGDEGGSCVMVALPSHWMCLGQWVCRSAVSRSSPSLSVGVTILLGGRHGAPTLSSHGVTSLGKGLDPSMQGRTMEPPLEGIVPENCGPCMLPRGWTYMTSWLADGVMVN